MTVVAIVFEKMSMFKFWDGRTDGQTDDRTPADGSNGQVLGVSERKRVVLLRSGALFLFFSRKGREKNLQNVQSGFINNQR